MQIPGSHHLSFCFGRSGAKSSNMHFNRFPQVILMLMIYLRNTALYGLSTLARFLSSGSPKKMSFVRFLIASVLLYMPSHSAGAPSPLCLYSAPIQYHYTCPSTHIQIHLVCKVFSDHSRLKASFSFLWTPPALTVSKIHLGSMSLIYPTVIVESLIHIFFKCKMTSYMSISHLHFKFNEGKSLVFFISLFIPIAHNAWHIIGGAH